MATNKQTVYTPNILWLDGSDGEIAAAVREAQRSFDRYRDALAQTSQVVADCGVKVFFPSQQDPKAGEHMWVNEVTFGSGDFLGTLCNDPGWLPGPLCGDRVSFTLDRVSDWFYVIAGEFHGGFSLKLLYRHYTPEQFAECRDDPPACYLADWYDELRREAKG